MNKQDEQLSVLDELKEAIADLKKLNKELREHARTFVFSVDYIEAAIAMEARTTALKARIYRLLAQGRDLQS